VVGSREYSIEPLGSVTGRKFDTLSDNRLLKDPAPWHWIVTNQLQLLLYVKLTLNFITSLKNGTSYNN
jgi:hypothetical protein